MSFAEGLNSQLGTTGVFPVSSEHDSKIFVKATTSN